MRSIFIAAAAIAAVAGATMMQSREAQAVVCARGVARAGCVATPAAGVVVVAKPVPKCTWVVVNGVRVKRCV